MKPLNITSFHWNVFLRLGLSDWIEKVDALRIEGILSGDNSWDLLSVNYKEKNISHSTVKDVCSCTISPSLIGFIKLI